MDNDIPYLLLTPGPLTTSRRVREAMMRDYSTWDVDYNSLVDRVRDQLVRLATNEDGYTCVLMQGSGTFAVEATLGSVLPADGKLLVINNGAYGQRMATIAGKLGIPHLQLQTGETHPPTTADLQQVLAASPGITHVAMVHCETTTGMLNPVAEIGQVVKNHGCCYIVDAMSSLGGVPLSMEELHADYLVSSANKCIQGVPGFGFVIARQQSIEAIDGQARSLSLDLFDQWQEMESKGGKWRYTSPTHVVCAFAEALAELEDEGGVEARHRRYCENQQRLVKGMEQRGFRTLLPGELQSPVITAFYDPCPGFDFATFYDLLKQRRFVVYPGKVSEAQTFRIGTIGHVFPDDIDELLDCISEVLREMEIDPLQAGGDLP
ncbi:MAG: 2-aminoethylphosphonate--pyruvate transaminase [Planctomycetota bacterium]|nr:2-aminoethylphosphonate--pyruvate transaminase [Planctomycetota bacterium]